MRRTPLSGIVLAAILAALATVAGAQDAPPPPERERPRAQPLPAPHLMPHSPQLELRRRLMELDRLLAVGSVARAESLVEELAGHSALAEELLSRRIRIAQLRGDHAEAVRLTREALVAAPYEPGLWRQMAEGLLALDEPTLARAAVDSFLVRSPGLRGAAVVSVEIFQRQDRPRIAVALVDSMRLVMGEPGLMTRQRALGLLAADEQVQAADEVSFELRANPMNLGLVRAALLDGPYRPSAHADFLARARTRARDEGASLAEVVLVMNLMLVGGDAEGATLLVSALDGSSATRRVLLQNAQVLARELRLVDDRRQRQALVDYLLPLLEELAGPDASQGSFRRQAAELLAITCGDALDTGALGDDPERAVERFGAALEVVRRVYPTSGQLHAAQINLAIFTRDQLGEPRQAARRLEGMLLDLGLSTEGVALVRLTLGECYLADGDTARGRVVLTRLGRDRQQRKAAGHAHYHLARLDLAGGDYATARDRFAVVALDNPAASYANDALELGLAVAEELENPTGGPQVLALYAPTVYYDLTRRPDERRRALRDFVRDALAVVDTNEPQNLLERGRWELAGLETAAGDTAAALALLTTIQVDHPDGRYPAAALAERSRLLLASGRQEASRAALEQLLAQYPDYLFAADVRDELRSLP